MGLQNKALHMMLANPKFCPFVLLETPNYTMRWTFVDHLVIVYKLKESDYVERDSAASVNNMARRLTSLYSAECESSDYLVLVKDGHGAKKPSVSKARNDRKVPPQITFYKKHSAVIEYATLRMLCDEGLKDRVYFVTGSDQSHVGDKHASCVTLHRMHLDEQTDLDDSVRKALDESSRLSNRRVARCNRKPLGTHGVFTFTFADPDSRAYSIVTDASARCVSAEADTLMVELANMLPGPAMICTLDSDLVAITTAVARADVILRLDNMSYTHGKSMFLSHFQDLVHQASAEQPTDTSRELDLGSTESRWYALCDVAPEQRFLAKDTYELHERWEDEIKSLATASQRQVARALHRSGIRGALYAELLDCVFNRPGLDDTRRELVEYIVDVSADYESGVLASESAFRRIFKRIAKDGSATTSVKRKGDASERSTDDALRRNEHLPRSNASLAEHVSKDYEGRSSPRVSFNRYARVNKLYRTNTMPSYTYGRYLRVCASGPYFYTSVKPELREVSTLRTAHLMFMILSGTDYTYRFPGLGSSTLMRAAADRGFREWCTELITTWSRDRVPTDAELHARATKLAALTAVPDRKLRAWTETCTVACMKSMKYVYELWTLQNPTYGPDYGFEER